jgi:hypothetical protein
VDLAEIIALAEPGAEERVRTQFSRTLPSTRIGV